MNYFTSIIFSGLAALCLADYTEKQLQTINFIVGKCAQEQDIELNSDFTKQWMYTGLLFPDEEISKKFAVCLDRAIGVLDADGTFKPQVLIDLMADGHDVQIITEHINKCITGEGDTIEDRGYNFYKCYWGDESYNSYLAGTEP
ncbi:uncharacterized protein LOC131428443 isoform X3 [Malaya genurostris]|uniref:uncharacterized protein LOC131428443 isoform X3 n=1 Tax=Malaya genurostris TaxID=325434 RepID=UPI0026F3EDC6|nr:uncharacterized protein LOC131428443 isoform X3 [Malaya genurostris]